MDIATEKQRLRDATQERLLHIPERQRQTENRLLCKRLQELFKSPPPALAAFFPLASEPDIRPFLRYILAKGTQLYLPAADSGAPFSFRRTEDLANLETGEWNIPQPPITAQPLDPLRLTHALIPGRAFDRKGWRIGRGRAGYDIWLREQRRRNPSTIFWGIAFACQILPTIPHTDHDERVDGIVTARGFTIT